MIKLNKKLRAIPFFVIGTAGILGKLILEGNISGALWYSLFIIAGVLVLLGERLASTG
ncbi:MAG: hypothetical protein QXI22_03725 [Sulfolobales archaeon]